MNAGSDFNCSHSDFWIRLDRDMVRELPHITSRLSEQSAVGVSEEQNWQREIKWLLFTS